MLDLEDIFGPGGPLERALPDFRVRRGQLRMAQRIADALGDRETLVVEAGTGTGKTFAYLVPALLSGARVLISTGTRTLQDQLYSKDLPLVAAALGRPARVALLKGRANYLCRARLGAAGDAGEQLEMLDGGVRTRAGRAMLARIARWAHTTESGDLAEIRGLSDAHPVWAQVTSTRDSCLGARCPEFARCHVALARRAALEADIVIVNHHLLLADLALKEDGFGDLLGSADAIILDEAHQIPDLATQFFGASVGSRQIEGFLKDAQLELRKAARGAAATARDPGGTVLSACLAGVEESLHALRAAAPGAAREAHQTARFPWDAGDTGLPRAAQELSESLAGLAEALGGLGEEPGSARLAERAGELAAALMRIAALDELEGARAVEVSARGITLSLMPFDIAARFRGLIEARRGAWIFTSATLSLGEEFGHFTGRLGVPDCPTLRIESPFDHERQSLLYLPGTMPQPSSPAYVAAVIDTALPLIEAAGGGAFVLFTSHRALAQGAALVRTRWAEATPYRLFVQGEAPRERLLEEFRDDGNGVLLGTASFWEGVDVKGEALRLVVIEKLPFASPEDPLVRARIEHLTARGVDAFRDYQLPEAVLALKQGAGRLIRSEEDYGAVVICDPRLTARSYGRVFLGALPPMTVTQDAAEVRRFLRRHSPRAAPRTVPAP
jgi:ATP-dependent DNA helicase DinG